MAEEEIKKEVRGIPLHLIIIGIILIICLIILGTLFRMMARENARCSANPFVFGAQELSEQGKEVTCSCIPLNPKYGWNNEFSFDKDGIIDKNSIGSNP